MSASVPVVFVEAQQGNVRALSEAQLEPTWTVAAIALSALARREPDEFPTVRAFLDGVVIDGAGAPYSLIFAGVRALLETDHPALQEIYEQAKGADARAALHVGGLLSVLNGNAQQVRRASESLVALGREHADARAVTGGTLLAAIAALLDEEFVESSRLMRRALRMAQTERDWVFNFLAGIFFVRVRRLSGQAHIASRVAAACHRASGHLWHGWLSWERVLAGAEPLPSSTPLGLRAREASTWLLGEGTPPASGGDVALIEEDIRRLRAVGGAFDRGDAREDEVLEWVRGSRHELPPMLSGLAMGSQRTQGHVFVSASGPSHRTMRKPREVKVLEPSGSDATRVEVLLSRLVFAPEALSREALFRQAYGFRYRPEVHEAAFKTLRSRLRHHIEGLAELKSENANYALQVEEDFAFPDPSSQAALADSILGRLGESRGSAKQLAADLGIPLRTVQAALRSLVEYGSCSAQRVGRRIEYVVEDTNFQEITLL
ncbi:MAG: hypothetical protein AAF938_20390 [Myxococcota bacterium]